MIAPALVSEGLGLQPRIRVVTHGRRRLQELPRLRGQVMPDTGVIIMVEEEVEGHPVRDPVDIHDVVEKLAVLRENC